MPLRNSQITFKEVQMIPENMLYEFKREAKTDQRYVEGIKRSEIKIGAFAGNELVGFVTGGFDIRGSVVMSAIYVMPKYRQQNIGARLTRRIGWRARNKEYRLVTIEDMRLPLSRTLAKEKKRLEGHQKIKGGKIIDIGLLGNTPNATMASIWLPKRKPK